MEGLAALAAFLAVGHFIRLTPVGQHADAIVGLVLILTLEVPDELVRRLSADPGIKATNESAPDEPIQATGTEDQAAGSSDVAESAPGVDGEARVEHPKHSVPSPVIWLLCLARFIAGVLGWCLHPSMILFGILAGLLGLSLLAHNRFRDEIPELQPLDRCTDASSRPFDVETIDAIPVNITLRPKPGWMRWSTQHLGVDLRRISAAVAGTAVMLSVLAGIAVALEGEPPPSHSRQHKDHRDGAAMTKNSRRGKSEAQGQASPTQAAEASTLSAGGCQSFAPDGEVSAAIATSILSAFKEPGPRVGCPGKVYVIQTSQGISAWVFGEAVSCAQACSVVVYSKRYRGAYVFLWPAVDQAMQLRQEYGTIGGPKTFSRYPAGNSRDHGDYYLISTMRGTYVLIRRHSGGENDEVERYLELPPSVSEAWLSAMRESGWLWPRRGASIDGDETFELGDASGSLKRLHTVFYNLNSHAATRARWHYGAVQPELAPAELEGYASE